MVQVRAEALAIDDRLAVVQTIEVSARRVIVQAIGLFGRDSRAGIFDDAGTFVNRRSSEHTSGMNAGGSDNQGHATNFACMRPLVEDGNAKTSGKLHGHSLQRPSHSGQPRMVDSVAFESTID